VDVQAVLRERAAKKGEPLDWRHSIVDLMKVLDLDSSLAARAIGAGAALHGSIGRFSPDEARAGRFGGGTPREACGLVCDRHSQLSSDRPAARVATMKPLSRSHSRTSISSLLRYAALGAIAYALQRRGNTPPQPSQIDRPRERRDTDGRRPARGAYNAQHG
jgi:uncharacterized protein DUF3597